MTRGRVVLLVVVGVLSLLILAVLLYLPFGMQGGGEPGPPVPVRDNAR